MSRAILTIIAVSLVAGAARAQEGGWRPVNYEGQQYLCQPQENGHAKFRMTPQQLRNTLGQFEADARHMGREASKLNLPGSVKRAPIAAIRLAEKMVQKMGGADGIFFYNPPRGGDIRSFTFTDGKRFVKLQTIDVSSQGMLTPFVSAKVFRVKDRQEIVERSVNVMLKKKSEDAMRYERERGRAHRGVLGSPWIGASLSTEGRSGKRWMEYSRLSRPGQWFGRRGSQRAGAARGTKRYVLRSGGKKQRPQEVGVKGMTAERLYILAEAGSYRTKLPKWHRRYQAGSVSVDDVSTDLLHKAGVRPVVDKRGRVYLSSGPKLNRALLREHDMTYVKRSRNGRRSHLRHLRTPRTVEK